MFNEDKYYIFCNEAPAAWGLLKAGEFIGSNCLIKEWFDTEEAYLIRCEELGINPTEE